MSMPRLSRTWSWRILVLLLGLWLFLDLSGYLSAESLWFQEVGYLEVFWVPIVTRGLLGAMAFSITAGLLWGNLYLAEALKHPAPQTNPAMEGGRERHHQKLAYGTRIRKRFSPGWRIYRLLFLVLGLGLLRRDP
jgi:uncharacterized membrane protein (UPF0182 family)